MSDDPALKFALQEQVRTLRIVVKDLCYIVKELAALEPRVSEDFDTVLEDHMNSLGDDDGA